MRKIKTITTLLIVLFMLVGQKAFASLNIEQDLGASESQMSCVFNVGIAYPMDKSFIPESYYVKLKLTNGVYGKTVPLSEGNGILEAYSSITAPLPDKVTSITVRSEFYADTGQGDRLISSESEDVECTNPSYEKQKQDDQIRKELESQVGGKIQGEIFKASSKYGGSSIQFGNRSFNIGGIGAALSGCMGIGNKITSQLGSLFGSDSTDNVTVDDTEANQKESCGDALAYAASRVVIQNMSKSVLGWATSGNNGNPFYPTNYSSFFNNIQNNEARNFIYELQNTATNNPYSQNFARSMSIDTRNSSQTFAQRTAYTGPNASFFQDFRNGGWDAWFKFIQPQNNSLGYSMLASQEASKRKNEAVENNKQELSNNNGFISWKECSDKGYVAWKDEAERSKNTAAAKYGDQKAIDRVNQATCKNYKTVTPGSVISDQLNNVLGSPLRQAEQVDEIDEALGRIFDGIVTNLINKGLTSLTDKDFVRSVDFSFNANNDPNSALPTGGTFWDNYNTNFDLRTELPKIIKTQKAYVDQVTKNARVLGLLLNSIDRMDYALPGPRVGWDEGIQARIQQLAQDLTKEMNYQTGGAIGNILSLGMRDKVVENATQLFLDIFNEVFGIYSKQIYVKFDPANNPNMPSESSRMIGLIKNRSTYEQTLDKTLEDVERMQDIIVKLEDINNGVIALYKKACARFLKDNPGATCI